jgi:hypothetical protein
MHRFSLPQLAARLAIGRLAAAEITPSSAVGAEASAVCAAYEAATRNQLPYFTLGRLLTFRVLDVRRLRSMTCVPRVFPRKRSKGWWNPGLTTPRSASRTRLVRYRSVNAD